MPKNITARSGKLIKQDSLIIGTVPGWLKILSEPSFVDGGLFMETQDQFTQLEQKQRLGKVRMLASPESGCNNCAVVEEHYEACGHCPPHYHNCDEVLVFLEGEGTLFVGQEPRPVFAGTTVTIPSGTPHCLYNTGIGHIRLLSFLPKANPEIVFVDGLFTSGPPVIATEEMFAGML